MANNSSSSGGIGFIGVLTIVFIVLKLTGHIHWSWLWVLSPLWVGPLIVIALFVIVAICALACAEGKNSTSKRIR